MAERTTKEIVAVLVSLAKLPPTEVSDFEKQDLIEAARRLREMEGERLWIDEGMLSFIRSAQNRVGPGCSEVVILTGQGGSEDE